MLSFIYKTCTSSELVFSGRPLRKCWKLVSMLLQLLVTKVSADEMNDNSAHALTGVVTVVLTSAEWRSLCV